MSQGVDQPLKLKAIGSRLIVAIESVAEKFRQDGASKRLSVGFA
jgi:hypothetical protein